MLTIEKIFSLASRDARTGSIPKKESPTPGQFTILNDNEFNVIKDNNDKIVRLNKKRDGLFREMLSMQSVFEENTNITNERSSTLKTDLEKVELDLALIDEEILNEQNLLNNRGIVFPANEIVHIEEEFDVKRTRSMFASVLMCFMNFWKLVKKPLGRFLMFAIAEVFVAFLLWDILRDHKSEMQTIFRIAASAVIFATLHFAEVKHKKNGKWWDIAYILFAWSSAMILLLGSIIIVSVFPDLLDTAPSIEQTFDLNGTNVSPTTSAEGNSFLSIYVRYDFLIAVVCLLIFMLITILDKDKPKKAIKTIETPVEKSVDSVFVPLANLYTQRNAKSIELTKLRTNVERINNNPTSLVLEINKKLKTMREQVEGIDEDILTTTSEIKKSLKDLADKLKKYEVDYLDVFKNSVASNFEKPEWIEEPEILNYYNIKTI